MKEVNTIKVEAPITKVTAFRDRAQITRTFSMELNPGEHSLVFTMLPNGFDKNSVQVNGAHSALVLVGVSFKTEYTEAPPDERRAELNKEKDSLASQIKYLRDRQQMIECERKLMDDYLKSAVSPPPAGVTKVEPVDLSKLSEIRQYYRTNAAELVKELRSTEAEVEVLTNKLSVLEQQLRRLGVRRNQIETIQVLVRVLETASVSLSLSYVVYSVSWTPLYDLRVSSEDKKFLVSYNGMVTNRSGEDWEEVHLQLSTAQPELGGQQPELKPWRIGEKVCPRPRRYSAEPEFARNMMVQMVPAELCADAEFEAPPPPPMAIEAASVVSKATSVFFDIAGLQSVKADNQPTKVPILQHEFPATFRFSTVPKLAAKAYLKARLVNTTDFPLLAGEASVFLDNNFVTTTQLPLVSPGDDQWVFLGVDDSIAVTHTLVRRQEQLEGGMISSKRRKIVFEYKIEIKSNKTAEEEVVVWDQLPISSNKLVVVELQQPEIKDSNPSIKRNNVDFIEWFHRISPGQTISSDFKFSVEYPHDFPLELP
eukprot:NODE_882_length_1847_cov_32.739155_g783_i0.p1 GENE.NODE_882_length_1847_cov_32.739155_g783_i0~~NODE_882_length_1847_cov_32.739155_g783_i0.p1  ORF type:complete len:561 (+),score=145.77 NODE_882_length_1847_cov_32.739155_g783_i0:69-1685(+)